MNKNRRALLQALLISALSCTGGMICAYVPFMIIFMFFIAIPLIILVRLHGIRYAVFSLMLSVFILMGFTGPVNTLLLILLPGVPALVTGIGMNQKRPVFLTLFAGFLTTMLMYILVFAFVQAIVDMPVREVIKTGMQSMMEMDEEMQNRISGTSAEKTVAAMKASMEQAWMLVPSALIIWSCGAALMNYALASKILQKTEKPVEMLPPLCEFRLPKTVMPGILLILVLTMAATYFNIIDQQMMTANVMILVQFTFAAQGLAVLFFIFHFYRVHKAFEIIVIIVLLFSGFFMILLMITGMFDIIFNLRNRLVEHKKK